MTRTEVMATAGGGKWGCGLLWKTLPAPAQSLEGFQAHSPPLPRLLAALTARIPAASAPTQRSARPTPAPPPRRAPPTWPWDPTLGHHLAAAPVSPANQSRSVPLCRPIRGCEGTWLRPRCDPGLLLLVALPPRSCPDSLSSRPRHSSAPRGRPSYSTRSARSLNDHAVPPLHPQMAEDLVPRIPLLGGY